MHQWLTTLIYKPVWAIKVAANVLTFLFRSRRSLCKPRVFNFFRALRTEPLPETKDLKIGIAGFCWGGQYAVLLTHDTPSSRVQRANDDSGQIKPLIDCAHTAHPSFLSVPKDIEAVSLPLSVAVGDKDMVLSKDKAYAVKEILEKKKAGDHEVVIYQGAKHGFAVRGDPDDPSQFELGENSRSQALAWFSSRLQ